MSINIDDAGINNYYVNNGKTNDYILHLNKREKAYHPFVKEEKQYIFNREPGESWQQLRERIKKIALEFCFSGKYPDMKVYRTRKNFNLY